MRRGSHKVGLLQRASHMRRQHKAPFPPGLHKDICMGKNGKVLGPEQDVFIENYHHLPAHPCRNRSCKALLFLAFSLPSMS